MTEKIITLEFLEKQMIVLDNDAKEMQRRIIEIEGAKKVVQHMIDGVKNADGTEQAATDSQ